MQKRKRHPRKRKKTSLCHYVNLFRSFRLVFELDILHLRERRTFQTGFPNKKIRI